MYEYFFLSSFIASTTSTMRESAKSAVSSPLYKAKHYYKVKTIIIIKGKLMTMKNDEVRKKRTIGEGPMMI